MAHECSHFSLRRHGITLMRQLETEIPPKQTALDLFDPSSWIQFN